MYIHDVSHYVMGDPRFRHVPQLTPERYAALKARWGIVYVYSPYWRTWSEITLCVRRGGIVQYGAYDPDSGRLRSHQTRTALWLCSPKPDQDPTYIYNSWAERAGAELLEYR